MVEEEDESNRWEEQRLTPFKEDIAEWLSTILGQKFAPDTLFDDLQTGTVLCRISHTVFHNAKELHKHNHDSKDKQSPNDISRTSDENAMRLPKPPKFSDRAKPGSFLARDNAANFISWCRELGINDTCLFESEGLVLQKQKRNVLLCLLELARIASPYGLPTPELIHLEHDIDRKAAKDQSILQELNRSNDQFAQIPPSLDRRKRKKVLLLDDAVHKVVDNSKFKGVVTIERTGEGRYRIQDKLLFIRMLRNQHVMVRVGGGWDTLEHYLDTHDTTRAESPYKLLSFTDVTREKTGYSFTKVKKFHQVRTRIPLRTKQ